VHVTKRHRGGKLRLHSFPTPELDKGKQTICYPLMHNIQYVDIIKIIKYLKVLQHVSDHRRSIIREPSTVLRLKTTRMILSCPLIWTRSVLWQHILTRCVCVCVCVVHCIGRHCLTECYVGHVVCKAVSSYTVNYTHAQRVKICYHNTDLVHVNGHDRIILVIFSQVLYKAP